MSNSLSENFDLLFIGMGASNCLLLLKMYENDLLKGKSIAIIEPSDKNSNDRNFCFWCSEEELHELELQDLIFSRWDKVKVVDREPQSIFPLNYYHIRGIDLYNKVKKILLNFKVKNFKGLFKGEPTLQSKSFVITLENFTIVANKVFDSRPPSFASVEKHQSHLLQSFYGWEIEVNDYEFDNSTMVMMDFNVPQNNYCQFMYILPFSKKTALFEVTRFGKEKISKEESEQILIEYLNQYGFKYQIIEQENGVIPMSSLKINSVDYGNNWTYTGSNANMIKPTTGYAFHNMVVDAKNIVDAMKNQKIFSRKKSNLRFKFYDNLLLKIIDKTPHNGKIIFQKLFSQTPIYNVLTFLNERSNIKEEITIFLKLPILIFLNTAFKDLFYRATNLTAVYFAFVFTIFSLVLYALNLEVLVSLILLLAFLSIGLSHGALDHLTENKIKSKKSLVKYILTYLLKASVLGLIWFILPDLALLVFIVFSAWHFGQADFQEWNLKESSNSFVWGLIVLLMIIFFHLDETVSVLFQIKGLKIANLLINLSDYQVLLVKLSLCFLSIFYIIYNKSKFMLLTFLYIILSSSLPLLISFGIYFTFQHSFQGWKHLKSDLKTSSYKLWIKSLPFSIGGILIFLTYLLNNDKDIIGIFFIILSCISLPHIILMNRFYLKFNRNKLG
jgi:lycopene beta-cyclase